MRGIARDIGDRGIHAIDKGLHHALMFGRDRVVHAHQFASGQHAFARHDIAFHAARAQHFGRAAKRAAAAQFHFGEAILRFGIAGAIHHRRRGITEHMRHAHRIAIDAHGFGLCRSRKQRCRQQQPGPISHHAVPFPPNNRSVSATQ